MFAEAAHADDHFPAVLPFPKEGALRSEVRGLTLGRIFHPLGSHALLKPPYLVSSALAECPFPH